jgi:hypothetical protein
MSEERNDDNGQFTPSTEGLYGREYDLAQAGFKSMPDPEKAKPDEFATPGDAAEALGAPEPKPIEAIIYYDKETGEPSDPKEAVTVEQAARDLSAWHDQKAALDTKSISSDLAAEVDKMRADVLKQNPKLAEQYGIEPPAEEDADSDVKPAAETADNNKSGTEAADSFDAIDSIDGLHPETAKALKIPQVRQALEQEFSKAQQTTEAYSAGLANAHAYAQASFLEGFPELAGLPPEQIEQGLAMLAQVDPPRFQTAMNVLNRVHTIQTAHQQEQQRQAHVARENFNAYAKYQDSLFRSMVGDNAPAKMQEVGTEMVAYFSELGIGRDQLVHELQTNPLLRSAAGQKVVYDAVQARLSHKAATAARKSVPKDIPPVQRPGTSQPRNSRSAETIQALEAKISTTKGDKQLRAASAALAARRAARG